MQYPEPIGSLTVLTSYVFHDTDLLFSGISAAGTHWIAVYTDHDDATDNWIWLFAELSKERLAEVDAGRIDFHDAFKLTESGDAWLLTTDYGGKTGWGEARKVVAAELPEERLPDPGTFADRLFER